MPWTDIFRSKETIAFEAAVAAGRPYHEALRAASGARQLDLDGDGARAYGRTMNKFHARGVQQARDQLKLNSVGTLAYDLSGGDKFVAYDAQKQADAFKRR